MNKIFNKYGNIITACALLLLVSAIAAKCVLPSVYFYPIDGNYQNYNIVRRMLDFQVPYRDFTVYLGLLHAYIGALFTFIFGNNFCACTYVFNFLTAGITALLSVFLGTAADFKFKFSACVTIGIILMLNFYNTVYPHSNITHLLFVENSAKMIRFAPALIAAYSVFVLLKSNLHTSVKKILIGLTAGVVFTFSNDYGITSAAAVAFLFTLKEIFENNTFKQKIISLCLYIAGGISGLFASLFILTQGNIAKWFCVNRDIGGFQAWYYNHKEIHYYLYQAEHPYLALFITVFTGFMLYEFFKNRDKTAQIAPFLIINISSLLVLFESNYLGGMSAIIVPYIFIILLFWYFAPYLKKIKLTEVNPDKFYIAAVLTALIFSVFSLIKGAIEYNKSDFYPEITKQIGGKYSRHSQSVSDGLKFLNGKKVFSTYSSAIEDITGQFQPSGYDYIIHVLGYNAREDYLKSFLGGNFDYVITQRPLSTQGWEFWIENANFFFYKELYKNYIPVYLNDYSIYWEKSRKIEAKTFEKEPVIEKEYISPYEVKITIKTDKNINASADLNIDYTSSYPDSRFLIHPVVEVDYSNSVKTTYEESMYTKAGNYTLPSKSSASIPVKIFEGEGSIVLRTIPHNGVITVNSAYAKEYYPVTFNYTAVINTDRDKKCLTLPLNVKNVKLTKEHKVFKIGNEIYNITGTEVFEDIYKDIRELYVYTDKQLPEKVYFIHFGEEQK